MSFTIYFFILIVSLWISVGMDLHEISLKVFLISTLIIFVFFSYISRSVYMSFLEIGTYTSF